MIKTKRKIFSVKKEKIKKPKNTLSTKKKADFKCAAQFKETALFHSLQGKEKCIGNYIKNKTFINLACKGCTLAL